MSSPEASPQSIANQQLTAEQIAELEAAGIMVDEAQAEQLYASAESEQQAIDILASAEKSALNNTVPAERGDAFAAVEAAQHDADVIAARKQVESMYGQRAVTSAIEHAIEDNTSVETKNTHEIASTLATGKTELASAETTLVADSAQVTDSEKTKEQFAELKDKVNGDAENYLQRIAKRTNNTLKSVGVHQKEQELETQAVDAAGAELTSVSGAHEAQQELVGKSIVAALVDNNPSMSGHARKELIEEAIGDPAKMRHLADAMRYQRRGGRRAEAFKKVGKDFSKAA